VEERAEAERHGRRADRLIDAAWLALVGLLLGVQLLASRPIGLADNGDGWRLLQPFGLVKVGCDGQARVHLCRTYELRPEAAKKVRYRSSALLFVGGAVAAHRLAGERPFDLRWIGGTYLATFLAAAAFALRAFRSLDRLPRVAALALAALVLTDVGYSAYFNSFYTEPASLVLLLATIGAGVRWAQSGWRSGAAAAATVVLGALFVAAKVQNASVGLLAAAALGCLAIRLRMRRTGALPLGIAAVLLGAVSILVLTSAAPPTLRAQNLYNAVFWEILRNGDAPAEDLAALGIDPALASFAGTSAYTPRTAFGTDQLAASGFGTLGMGGVLAFYAARPGRLFALLERGAANALHLRPDDLGNLGPEVPPHAARTDRFAVWSGLRERLASASPVLLLAAALTCVAAATAAARMGLRAAGAGVLFLAAAAASQFVTVLVAEGDWELTKHLWLFHLLLDLALIGSAGLIAQAALRALAARPRPLAAA